MGPELLSCSYSQILCFSTHFPSSFTFVLLKPECLQFLRYLVGHQRVHKTTGAFSTYFFLNEVAVSLEGF